ncbi:MAG: DUF3606 domain-containing protein [Pirellulales bacterium]
MRTTTWPADSTEIDIDQPDDVEFWSQRFQVSAGMLKRAVRQVGSKFKDVAYLLKSQQRGEMSGQGPT